MKNLEQINGKLEQNSIYVDEYKEDNKLCGYELDTCTNNGVNQIIFLDFRNTELDPKNAKDFIQVYSDRINSINIDEEIDLNRQAEDFKNAFTLSDAVQDFKDWKHVLENIFPSSTKKTAEQRQFEQVKDKLETLLAEMEETLKLIPRKGDRPAYCQRINISNQLGGLDHCINGLKLEDFTPNEYSADFKLSYS